MTDAESRAYSRGYGTGLRGHWPQNVPPAPPDNLVADFLSASIALRDAAATICSTLSEDDEFVRLLDPLISRIDDQCIAIRQWLSAPTR